MFPALTARASSRIWNPQPKRSGQRGTRPGDPENYSLSKHEKNVVCTTRQQILADTEPAKCPLVDDRRPPDERT